MKSHTTNYINTFIAVAEDCPAIRGEAPALKGDGTKSIANAQFEMLKENPYRFTSDDVLFKVYADRNGVKEVDLEQARSAFFSKGQPCFRSSPLSKRYGWGIHHNEKGKIALYGMETEAYRQFVGQPGLKVVNAMRSKRK